MKIAVINETSSADRNADILVALEGRGHDIFNIGMKKNGEEPELSYIETGLMTAILLNLNRVDFVVGGCGTGQGYLESAMQYPGVICGHIVSDLDAWLFTKINGGNCISLQLNQGYGWAAGVNLKFIFDRIFSVESGSGYPSHRKKPQAEYRKILKSVSKYTHFNFTEIIKKLPDQIIKKVLNYPGMKEVIDIENIQNINLRTAFLNRMR